MTIENIELNNIAANIQEAREYNGLSVTELAKIVDVSKQSISAYEKAIVRPSDKVLIKIASALGFTDKYFFKDNSEKANFSLISYRKFKSTSKKELKKSTSISKILGKIVYFMDKLLDLPVINLPDYNKNAKELSIEEIEYFALNLRALWDLGKLPIYNLTLLLEKNGISISSIPMGDKIDAFSFWHNDRPIIILSKDKLHLKAVRMRYDLAHELAHLILHKNINPEDVKANEDLHKRLENEANCFASAFLLPEEDFIEDLISYKFYALAMQKKKWGVSIQAMIVRLSKLGLITKNKEVYLYMQIKDRKNEIYDDEIKPEKPSFLNNAFKSLLDSGLKKESISNMLDLSIPHLIEIASLDESLFIDKEDYLDSFSLKSTTLLQNMDI